MKQNQYIAIPEVSQFIEFFAEAICVKFRHEYLIRQTNEKWSCDNIKGAALNYRWPWRGPGNLLCDSVISLSGFQSKLLEALQKKNLSDLRDISLEVFKWGGVTNGNANRVRGEADQLAAKYSSTISQLHLGGDDAVLDQVWNMNSGFTKVYSLLSDGLIMYDSRVGAALGYLVKLCAIKYGWKSIPEALLFPYAPPRNGVTAQNPLNRDPGQFHGTNFPNFSGRAALQAKFMLRASWIVNAVIEKLKCLNEAELKCGKTKISKHRFIEAGLFMVGYDLPTAIKEKELSKKPPADVWSYKTLCRARQFNVALAGSDLKIIKSSGSTATIKIAHIIKALLWLIERCGTVEYFPLDNNAPEVRRGSEKNGLGSAFFSITDGAFNPPDASCIAALLYNLRILEWNQNCRSSEFRIETMPTYEHLVDLLVAEFSGRSNDF
jgi:hypothetical protein